MTRFRKSIVLAFVFAGLSRSTLGQTKLGVSSLDGGPVTLHSGGGVGLNEGSTLHRKWYVINDPSCPISLAAAGVNATHEKGYSFTPAGSVTAKEAISAFEVRFVIFDIWGNHMGTFSDLVLRDIIGGSPFQLEKTASWRASEHEVRNYFTSVAFVAHVRTRTGNECAADTKALLREVAAVKLNLTQDQLEPPKPRE